MITGEDKINHSDFSMPRFGSHVDGKDVFSFPTYADIVHPNDRTSPSYNQDYCYQCVFAGGKWTTLDEKSYCALSKGSYVSDVPLKVE